MWQMISAIGSVLTMLISGACFFTIKFNDLKHIQLAVEKIQQSVKIIEEDSTKLKITVAENVVRCNERHRTAKRNK